MQKAKYVSAALLFLLAFVLVGEIFIWRLYTFSSEFPYTTVYLQEGQSVDELVSDALCASEEASVDFFVINTEIHSSISASIHIYGTEEIKDKLASLKIKEGQFRSLFLGEINIQVEKLNDLPEEIIPSRFFLLGSHADNIKFKQLLIDKYAGNYPREVENAHHHRYLICGLWLVIFSFLLIISVYNIALLKRESVIRMVSGEPLASFVLANILRDTIAFTITFTLTLFLTGIYTESTFCLPVTICTYVSFIVINAILNARLLKVDFRKDAGSKQSAKNVLKVSHVYKCAVIMAVIFVVNGNIQLVKEGVEYYSQKEFFEARCEYYYVNISTRNINDDTSDSQILIELISDKRRLSLVDLQVSDKDLNYIYTDRSAEAYLRKQIPSLDNVSFGSKVYFLIPKELNNNASTRDTVVDIWSAYYRGTADYSFIEYDRANILAIKNMGSSIDSAIATNPVIIFNNLDSPDYLSFFNLEYIVGNTLFCIPEDDLSQIDQNKQFNYCTNAYENYMFHVESAKRNIFTGLVFMSLALLLNLIISKNMLYYEYKIRAVEYSLKKILGENTIRANLNILLLSVVAVIFAGCISTAVMLLVGEKSLIYSIVGCVISLLVDTGISLHYIRVMSRISFIRVFKGGDV